MLTVLRKTNFKRRIKSLCINILCTCIVLVLCSCKGDLTVDNPNLNGNLLDNIDSNGYMAIQDDFIFFYQNTPNQQGLYRSKVDGSNKTKLCSGIISDINVVGSVIYYVKETFVSKTSYESKDLCTLSLYSIDINGTDEKKIIENCNKVYVSHNYIYYLFEIDSIAYKYNKMNVPQNQNYLYRYSIDDKTSELLVDEPVNSYRVDDQDILFTNSSQDKIFKVSAKDSEHKKSIVFDIKSSDEDGNDKYVCFFTVDNKKMLIVYDGETLFALDSITLNKKTLYKTSSEQSCYKFVCFKDFIYTIENEKNVIMINRNENNTERLLEIPYLNNTYPNLYSFKNGCYYFDAVNLPILIS